MHDDYMVFIFKRGKAIYAISAESEENAYEQLQQKLSINMKFVRAQTTLLAIMNSYSPAKRIQ